MGDDKGNTVIGNLKKNKYTIALVAMAIVLVIAAAAGVYMYKLSSDRAAQIVQQRSDYAALNASYGTLNNNYEALVASDNDLQARYVNLTNSYNSLSSAANSSVAAYESLNQSLSGFQETGGPAIALYYTTYNSGTAANPNFTVTINAYNVGDETDGQFTIKCRVIFNGTPSEEQQTFTDVGPLQKKSVTWVFIAGTSIDDVWVD